MRWARDVSFSKLIGTALIAGNDRRAPAPRQSDEMENTGRVGRKRMKTVVKKVGKFPNEPRIAVREDESY
jgi:hypothetical protein